MDWDKLEGKMDWDKFLLRLAFPFFLFWMTITTVQLIPQIAKASTTPYITPLYAVSNVMVVTIIIFLYMKMELKEVKG